VTKRQIEDRFRHGTGAKLSLVVPYRWAVAAMAGVIALGGLEIVGADARSHTPSAGPRSGSVSGTVVAPGDRPEADVLSAFPR
jgi:hypothetical protein